MTHPLTAPGPAPRDAELRLSVTCRTSRAAGAPTIRHPVTIDAQWRAGVPHDLDSERLAVALGGHLSCIELVDVAVPALREWLRRAARFDLPAIGFREAPAGEGSWTVTEAARCCDGTHFPDAIAAAEHWRSAQHVARVTGASARQLQVLAHASQRAHDTEGTLSIPDDSRGSAVAACTRGDADVAWLWEAGIHPRLVLASHAAMGTEHALPARFYLAVAWNAPDLGWIAGTLRDVADAGLMPDATEPNDPDHLVTWLAWTAHELDVADPAARARWLRTGITRRLIRRLGRAGYDPDEVVEHARAVRRHPDAAARTIAQWLESGFRPTPASLTALAATGVPPWTAPSRAAVARLRAQVDLSQQKWSDTELALLLVEHGTVADAVSAIANGARPR